MVPSLGRAPHSASRISVVRSNGMECAGSGTPPVHAPGAVLHLPGNVIREWGVLSMLTSWTDLDVRALLGHLQAKLRQAASPLLGVRSGQEVVDSPRRLIMNIGAVSGLATRTVPSHTDSG